MRSASSLSIPLLLAASLARSALAAEPDTGAPPPASGAEVTLAETLYREGRQLYAEQRYAEAATKFAESYRLDPATGTLLNLATCREAEGKLASAWIAFSDAMRAARREQRDDRVKFAEERIAAIEPRLSRLTLEVGSSARAPELVVRLDGVAIGPAAYSVPTPIDPGLHRIEASAPGKRPWSREVTIGGEADLQIVSIPPLEDAPPVAPVGPLAASGAETAPPRLVERPVPASVYVAGGATALLVAGSAITGVVYLGKTEPETDGDEKSARRLGWVNAGLLAATAVGAGITIYLYATRPEQRVESGVRLSTWATAGGGGLDVGAAF